MKVKSEYVRGKIRGKSVSDEEYRYYIGALTDIERYVLDIPMCECGVKHFWHLEEKYPEEFKAIFMELNPEDYKRYLRAKEEIPSKEELKRGDAEIEKQARDAWLECGGTA